VLKEQRTIPLDVVAIAQRAGDRNRIEQGSEKSLPIFEGDSTQIQSVQVDQVESLKAELSCSAAAYCVLKFLKIRSAIAVEDYDFAIDNCCLNGKGSRRRREIGKFVSPVLPVPAPKAYLAMIEAAQHPISIELQFMHPLISRRRGFDQCRKLRRNESW
jgi:hypothetical protein